MFEIKSFFSDVGDGGNFEDSCCMADHLHHSRMVEHHRSSCCLTVEEDRAAVDGDTVEEDNRIAEVEVDHNRGPDGGGQNVRAGDDDACPCPCGGALI